MKESMIRLTMYGTGEPVYIRSSIIESVTQLPSQQFDTGHEEGLRCRVDAVGSNVWLVNETADEIIAMLGYRYSPREGGAS